MGYKSRGNWSVGICFEDCKCLQCRRKREEEMLEEKKEIIDNLPQG